MAKRAKDNQPRRRRKRALSSAATPVSYRMSPELLATLRTDATERNVFTTTLLNFIIAAYYGNVEEQVRADCARDGEAIRTVPTVQIGKQ